MDVFELTGDDVVAIELAKTIARRLLSHPLVTPKQIVGLGKALHILERLPSVTSGAASSFEIAYRARSEEFEEMRYIEFNISEEAFEISRGGSTYGRFVGGDSFSERGWYFDIAGAREEGCELVSLEDSIEEYLILGAKITVTDESEIDLDEGA